MKPYTLCILCLSATTLALSNQHVNAALSATTANTIEGTRPYFKLNGTSITSTDELLGFTYLDNSQMPAITVQIDANQSDKIITVPSGLKENDIKTLVMANVAGTAQPLATALSSTQGSGLEVSDDDGDVPGGVSATGRLIVKLTKNGSAIRPSNDVLSACNNYQLTVTISNPDSNPVKAITTYGSPNERIYSGSTTATYYITPQVVTPYPCFAKPNLIYGDNSGVWPNGATGYQFAGSAAQWDPTKGFVPQNVNIPSSNFPKLGFNGAYFELTLAGTTAAQVIADSTTTSMAASNIKLKLSSVPADSMTTNILKVELEGPSSKTNNGLGPIAVTGLPASFELKSGTTNVYSFRIEKWFIPSSIQAGNYVEARTYCNSISGFRLPTRSDYTNTPFVNTTIYPSQPDAETGLWTFTIPNTQDNYYKRAIGQGLFAEWGFTHKVYYPNSDWGGNYYLTGEFWAKDTPYIIYMSYGAVNYDKSSHRMACVSP